MNYEDFAKDWIKRHKSSIPRMRRVSSASLIFGLFLWIVIALGAAAVSGAHSVPAILQTIPLVVASPYREILSLSGFTIFELLIFAGALYRKESRFAAWGLVLAIVGALSANIGSSIYAVTENGGDGFTMAVAIIMAFIAPLAAFLAGEMVTKLREDHQNILDQSNADYDEKRKEIDAIINREWARSQKVFANSSRTADSGENSTPANTRDALDVIREYFEKFPDRRADSLNSVVEGIKSEMGVKVGRTSVHKYRKENDDIKPPGATRREH